MLHRWIAPLWLITLCATGCSTAKTWELVSDPCSEAMLNESDVVLDGLIVSGLHYHSFSLSTFLRAGPLGVPTEGWKQDIVFKPMTVVKGSFAGDRLRIHMLKASRDYRTEEMRVLTSTHPVRIGFRQKLFDRTADLKIAPLPPASDTPPSTVASEARPGGALVSAP